MDYGKSMTTKNTAKRGPLWFLGKALNDEQEFPHLLAKLIWLTYRYDFEGIGGHGGPTTDAGWGCMIRTGQNIFATALLRQAGAEDWTTDDKVYRRIISYFSDTPDAPLSIQNIAVKGKAYGKRIGEWFGPNTIACALRDLVAESKLDLPFIFYVSHESTIFKDEIRQLCTQYEQDKGSKPGIFMLLPTRLGLNSCNPIYLKTLSAYMKLQQSVGFVGGRPHSSYYFLGIQDDVLFYLDPHRNQKFVPLSSDADISSYSCKTTLTLVANEIDESLAIGFYCKDFEDFQNLVLGIEEVGKQCESLFWFEESQAQPTEKLEGDSEDDFSMDDF
eukprot:TRINITY_DN658_c0_g1_i1.p1 TRINITY_DN658_c0_g1~~TRINITY_DN658_c0_g1_i1.p1  ORF type:complete len:357 (+),score=53.89 TRINITY_DN658_c0_g1_i1:81-1073(+)